MQVPVRLARPGRTRSGQAFDFVRVADFAQDDRASLVRGIPRPKVGTWGTRLLWWVEGAKSKISAPVGGLDRGFAAYFVSKKNGWAGCGGRG